MALSHKHTPNTIERIGPIDIVTAAMCEPFACLSFTPHFFLGGSFPIPAVPLWTASSRRRLVLFVRSAVLRMGLNSATEDSEAAALWIVQTCRRWMAQVPAEDAGSRRADGRARQQQQLELIAGPPHGDKEGT